MTPQDDQREIVGPDAEKVLAGGKVVAVYSHPGSPGGHNNDRVVLTMESGDRITFDAYAMTGLVVRVKPA